MSDQMTVNAYIEELVKRSRAAQRKFEREYTTQRAIDEVVRAIGMSVLDHIDEISELAVSESRMGSVAEEKMKGMSAATSTWNFLRGKASVGEIPNIRPTSPACAFMPSLWAPLAVSSPAPTRSEQSSAAPWRRSRPATPSSPRPTP